ncbi:LPS-assembly protein LptD [Malonomonas rubra]|uniref:LPS-assembly protein LptD n=1 Tax=Malonomonas rubra TaxID=57040 RepID=UPI0026F0CDFF|nr:LPS assembly protein LptD [Malonomonas rubra]
MFLRFLAIILLCWPVAAVAADWDQVGEGEVPVNLEADELTYNKETGRYHAIGNVQLTQGEMEVHSKVLWWDQITGEVEASGDVQMSSPDEKISGSKVNYNLNQGTGIIEDGRVFLREKNLHVQGEQIERRGAFEYRIKEGTFTTCDGEVPSWKFGADQVDVTLAGYARAKNAVFYLKNIPSFYVPYIVYPVKTERESGLLTPRVGYSNKRGYQYNGAYYQVLGVNQDATLFFDYLSEMGIGKGLEYRYVFGNETEGEAQVYHIDVDQVDGEPVDEERYALEWQHDGKLPGGVRMVVDAMFVDDDEYFEDFGETADEYNKDKVQSILTLSKNWGKYNLVGQMKYTKDLEKDSSGTLQILPRITFDATRQRIGESFFYYELETEYSNFWREEGLRGERLILRPSLSASLQLFDVIDVTPEVAYRDRYYWGMSDGSDGEQEGIVEFSTKLNNTLQRVYEQPIGPIHKLRHSIEPEVIYLYTPELDQRHLPMFDSSDRIDEANRVEYALVQRFTARFDPDEGLPTYRELVYWRLSQSYDLREEMKDEPFSAIRNELTLLPTKWTRVEIDSTFDIDQGEWSKISAEADVHDQRDNRLSVNYRSDRDLEQEYGSVEVETSLLKPFYVGYENRYDLAESKKLEDVVDVEYRQQCWSALLTFRENDTDRSIMLSFVMKGIGPVGGFGASLLDR